MALGSPYKKSLFALMAGKNIANIRELKGKRIGVSQIGDAPYNYSIGLLGKAGVGPRDQIGRRLARTPPRAERLW